MKNRWPWILVGILLALLAAWWSTPRRPRLEPLVEGQGQGTAQESLQETEGAAGKAVFDSPEARIEASRQLARQMRESVRDLPPGQWLHDFELIERSGKPIGSKELAGQPYIASFFFSKCPSICVQQNDQMRLLQERLKDVPVRLVSITCDPEVDTPEVLRDYADRYRADPERWLFLTGTWDQLEKISSEVFFHGLHRPKEHIEKFLLMDAEGEWLAAYDWHVPEELRLLEKDIRALVSTGDSGKNHSNAPPATDRVP